MRLVKTFGDEHPFGFKYPDRAIFLLPEFQEAVEKLRRDFNIFDYDVLEGEDERTAEKRFLKKCLKTSESSEFQEAVTNRLIKPFKIPKRWADMFIDDVATGSSIWDDWDRVLLEIRIDDKTGEATFWLGINDKTTIEEIKKRWRSIKKEIQAHGKTKPVWPNPWPKMHRDAEIYRLVQQGKSIEEISQHLLERYGKDEDLDHGNIKKIESFFRKRMRLGKRKNKLYGGKSYRNSA